MPLEFPIKRPKDDNIRSSADEAFINEIIQELQPLYQRLCATWNDGKRPDILGVGETTSPEWHMRLAASNMMTTLVYLRNVLRSWEEEKNQ